MSMSISLKRSCTHRRLPETGLRKSPSMSGASHLQSQWQICLDRRPRFVYRVRHRVSVIQSRKVLPSAFITGSISLEIYMATTVLLALVLVTFVEYTRRKHILCEPAAVSEISDLIVTTASQPLDVSRSECRHSVLIRPDLGSDDLDRDQHSVRCAL